MKISKIISVFVIAMFILAIASNFALAYNPANIVINTDGTSNIQTLGEDIIGFIQVVGSIVSVAVIVVLGIKYMMGSTEEKAEYKKTMLPYLIGAVVVFAASNIAGFVYDFADTISLS